jgi:hypothetical protein
MFGGQRYTAHSMGMYETNTATERLIFDCLNFKILLFEGDIFPDHIET